MALNNPLTQREAEASPLAYGLGGEKRFKDTLLQVGLFPGRGPSGRRVVSVAVEMVKRRGVVIVCIAWCALETRFTTTCWS